MERGGGEVKQNAPRPNRPGAFLELKSPLVTRQKLDGLDLDVQQKLNRSLGNRGLRSVERQRSHRVALDEHVVLNPDRAEELRSLELTGIADRRVILVGSD